MSFVHYLFHRRHDNMTDLSIQHPIITALILFTILLAFFLRQEVTEPSEIGPMDYNLLLKWYEKRGLLFRHQDKNCYIFRNKDISIYDLEKFWRNNPRWKEIPRASVSGSTFRSTWIAQFPLDGCIYQIYPRPDIRNQKFHSDEEQLYQLRQIHNNFNQFGPGRDKVVNDLFEVAVERALLLSQICLLFCEDLIKLTKEPNK